MAIRWTIAAGIVLAEKLKESKHGEEDAAIDAHWTDMSRRFPLAAAELLKSAGTPAATLLRFIHPNQSVRKLNTALQKHQDFSQLPLTEERDGDDDDVVTEETPRQPRAKAAKQTTAPVVKQRPPTQPKRQVNVDAMLDRAVEAEEEFEEEDDEITV